MDVISRTDMKDDQLVNLSTALDSMRMQLVFTDVTLRCGKSEILAHRLILSAGSLYFRAMFKSGMQEAVSGSVELKGVSISAMTEVLNFIYTGNVCGFEQNVKLLSEVLAASHLLQIEPLYNYCRSLLYEILIKEKFIDLWDIAEHYNDEKLLQTIVSYLAENFEQICRSSMYLDLSVERLKQVLRAVPLKTVSADKVTQCILTWIKADESQRFGEIECLFGLLHLDTLTTECLSSLQNEGLIQNSPDIVCHLLRSATLKLSCSQSQLMCFGKTNNQSTVCVYSNFLWSPIKVLPFNLLLGTATVYLNRHIYFIGGGDCLDDSQMIADVLQYNYEQNCISRMQCLKAAKGNLGAAEFRGKIYAIGGRTATVVYRDVDVYDPETNCWEPVAETNKPHDFPRVAQVSNYIFVVGSIDCATVERYSPATDQWTIVEAIPETFMPNVSWPRVAVCDQRIYALHSCDKQMSIYDPISNTWETNILEGGSQSVDGIWGCCKKERNLPFLFVSGEDKILYKYDPETLQWDNLAECTDLTHSIASRWWQTLAIPYSLPSK